MYFFVFIYIFIFNKYIIKIPTNTLHVYDHVYNMLTNMFRNMFTKMIPTSPTDLCTHAAHAAAMRAPCVAYESPMQTCSQTCS